MLRIKRLYTFMLQTFLPMFVMTFGICLFILLIQFLWQHIEKLVGKGLDTTVLLELFFYAALNLVPMALPLAVLLASLMTFGNLGERLELLAIKASGVSLFKIMQPLIVLVVAITIGSFFFQNQLAPKFRVKVASLLYSIRHKSPEMDIPEGSFYESLPGYSIYVKKKNLETHMLYDVVIYESGSGFKNMSVDVCDSALMKVADSKDYITITLFNGERFANLKDEPGYKGSRSAEYIPYMKENYTRKKIIVPFDDDFTRIEESRYDDTEISKNLIQLQQSIDSMTYKLDSLNIIDRKSVGNQSFINYRTEKNYKDSLNTARDSVNVQDIKKENRAVLNIDSVFNSYSKSVKATIATTASNAARSSANNHLSYYHIEMPKPILQSSIRKHEIYWHRVFTLSLACLIFFFIGAPLAAIIRKGGLGPPVIISVLFFIFYYIIDTIGYKMAREGVWEEWLGMWFSTLVLSPIGIFLTYKSMNESALFNVEAYGKYFRKILRIKEMPRDELQNISKEEIALHVPHPEDIASDTKLIANFRALSITELRDMAVKFEEYGHEPLMGLLALSVLVEEEEDISGLVKDEMIGPKEFCFEIFTQYSYYTIAIYLVSIFFIILLSQVSASIVIKTIGTAAYLSLFLRSLYFYVQFYSGDIKKSKVLFYTKHFAIIVAMLVAYPLTFIYIKWDMTKELEKLRETSFFTQKWTKNNK